MDLRKNFFEILGPNAPGYELYQWLTYWGPLGDRKGKGRSLIYGKI